VDELPRDPDAGWIQRLELREVVVLVLIVAVAVAGVLVARDDVTPWPPASKPGGQHGDVLESADAQVLALTTLDFRRVDEQVAALRERTVGEFRQRFDTMVERFAAAVRKARIRAEGRILASGVVELSDDHAEVLVASLARVSAGAAAETERSYRFRVSLTRVDDEWLISEMEALA
jgi:SnoaL-like domain